MAKISAVISAHNEEKKIEKALKSLKFADEIIVIDHGSTDSTNNLAKKYTNKVYISKNDPQKIDIQKNLGFDKASYEWILSIDADEQVSDELAKEIKNLIKNPKLGVNGFWIPRENIMFGKSIKENTGWYPDYKLRFFKKDKGRYESEHVHEELKLEGKAEKLKGHIIHENYDSITQFVGKVLVYAPNEADNYIKNGYKFRFLDAVRFPLEDFLKWFFARKGYKDGFHGLILALLMAFYQFLVFCFIWEKKGYKEYEGNDLLSDLNDEFKHDAKELQYWIRKEAIENTKNPFKKTMARIKNKFTS